MKLGKSKSSSVSKIKVQGLFSSNFDFNSFTSILKLNQIQPQLGAIIDTGFLGSLFFILAILFMFS